MLERRKTIAVYWRRKLCIGRGWGYNSVLEWGRSLKLCIGGEEEAIAVYWGGDSKAMY